MDPITLIVTALAAGATPGLQVSDHHGQANVFNAPADGAGPR
jgi:hypothetical protein